MRKRKINIGLYNRLSKKISYFNSWEDVIRRTGLGLKGIRKIRRGGMYDGWKLRYLDGSPKYYDYIYKKKEEDKRRHPIVLKSPGGEVIAFGTIKEAMARTGMCYPTIRHLLWGYPVKSGWTLVEDKKLDAYN